MMQIRSRFIVVFKWVFCSASPCTHCWIRKEEAWWGLWGAGRALGSTLGWGCLPHSPSAASKAKPWYTTKGVITSLSLRTSCFFLILPLDAVASLGHQPGNSLVYWALSQAAAWLHPCPLRPIKLYPGNSQDLLPQKAVNNRSLWGTFQPLRF